MKTNEEYEREFIAEAKEKTGHTADEWMGILKSHKLSRMKEALDWMKNERGVGHMHASFLAGIYLNGGRPVYDSKVLFESHFLNNEEKRPLYQKIEDLVRSACTNLQVVPTKGYISFRTQREFAVTKINKKQIRVGLDLGDEPFDEYTEKAKSLGTMPRISHMIEIYEPSDVNNRLGEKIIEANKIVNQKN